MEQSSLESQSTGCAKTPTLTVFISGRASLLIHSSGVGDTTVQAYQTERTRTALPTQHRESFMTPPIRQKSELLAHIAHHLRHPFFLLANEALSPLRSALVLFVLRVYDFPGRKNRNGTWKASTKQLRFAWQWVLSCIILKQQHMN